MDDSLVPIALFVSLAFIITHVSRTISEGRTRRLLIQSGASAEAITAAITAPQDPGLYSALRWGLMLAAVGAGLVVVQFVPYQANQPIVTGIVLLFAAAGMLAYYGAARRMVSRPA